MGDHAHRFTITLHWGGAVRGYKCEVCGEVKYA